MLSVSTSFRICWPIGSGHHGLPQQWQQRQPLVSFSPALPVSELRYIRRCSLLLDQAGQFSVPQEPLQEILRQQVVELQKEIQKIASIPRGERTSEDSSELASLRAESASLHAKEVLLLKSEERTIQKEQKGKLETVVHSVLKCGALFASH